MLICRLVYVCSLNQLVIVYVGCDSSLVPRPLPIFNLRVKLKTGSGLWTRLCDSASSLHHKIDQAFSIFACNVESMGRPGYKAISVSVHLFHFLCEIFIFCRLVKVFSLESFLLYKQSSKQDSQSHYTYI